MAPAEDERDNVLNVAPHAEFVGNALYEYLPELSRGTGEPQPAARLELTTVDLTRGGKGFRGGACRGPIHPAGRDALVSDGGRRNRSALRPTAAAAQPVGDSRRIGEQALPDEAQRPDREDDRRDPESATDDELWPPAGSPVRGITGEGDTTGVGLDPSARHRDADNPRQGSKDDHPALRQSLAPRLTQSR